MARLLGGESGKPVSAAVGFYYRKKSGEAPNALLDVQLDKNLSIFKTAVPILDLFNNPLVCLFSESSCGEI
jgi:hypothetical protein